ncbi:hypothetical protein T458_22500 [Brevibacillus panacihumi W25]|uniref:Transcriptional regulator n=1 Tax=Brevibacillus panacihumi W25 TaxID=1408254 RepID=V6M5X8_9BACL|nr:hypothetical protein [Brevibacillus panacihumi]EST53969.1 hypothetical protein T458_22500 [Brevibacillus panacihumi W25]
MVNIGFISAEQSVFRIKEIESLLHKLCNLQIFTYKHLEEVKDIYLSQSLFLDGMICGGELAYLVLKKDIPELMIPTDYVDITERDFYKLMYSIQAKNRDLCPSRLAIDCLGKYNHYLGLKEVLPPELFPYTPQKADERLLLTYDEILDFHLSLWLQGKVDLSITRYSNVVNKLKENDIQFIHLYPSHESIIDKFNKMISDIQISQLVDKQVAIGNISIRNVNLQDANTGQLDLQLMLLHKSLLEYASLHHLPFMIQKRQLHFEIITSLRDLKETLTHHYTSCSLFEYLSEQLPFKVNIGWGSGDSLHKARTNAQSANKAAEAHPNNCSFVITEDDQVIGPLGDKACIQFSNSMNEQIEKWSVQLGISPLQIQKIVAVIDKTNSNELSSEDVSFYLGITIRSANRFLNILQDRGVASVSYKKQEKLRGRPKKMYRIDFSNIQSQNQGNY